MMLTPSVKVIFTLTVCSLVAACGAGYNSDNKTNIEAPSALGTDSSNAANSIEPTPSIAAGLPEVDATFDVTLVSVDVRRVHDGERINVKVDNINSGHLHILLSD